MKSISIVMATLLFIGLRSTACAQWMHTNGADGAPIECFAIVGTNILAGTGGGVFLSTNGGANWTLVNNGIGIYPIQSLAVVGTNLFASTPMNGVFLSTNNGTSWTPASTPFTGFSQMVESGLNLFAGTDGGVFLSTNNGTSWTAVSDGLPKWTYSRPGRLHSLASSGHNLFAGTTDGIFLSTNNGTSWTPVNTGLPSDPWIGRLAVVDSNLFAETTDGVFVSTNKGTNWTSLPLDFYFGDVPIGTDLFAPTGGGEVVLSSNRGASWTYINTGLQGSVTALAGSGTYLFAGTSGDGVWRRPVSELMTDVGNAGLLPTSIVLDQNYPNPFNPSTNIRYALPQKSTVLLTVFDALGQQVAVLQNGEQEAGYHEVKFDASGMSSGVYFYRLQASSFVEARKLLLLR